MAHTPMKAAQASDVKAREVSRARYVTQEETAPGMRAMMRGIGRRKRRDSRAQSCSSPARRARHEPAKRHVIVRLIADSSARMARAAAPLGAVGRTECVTFVAGTMEA